MEEQLKPVRLSAWEVVEIFFLPCTCRLIFVQKFPFRDYIACYIEVLTFARSSLHFLEVEMEETFMTIRSRLKELWLPAAYQSILLTIMKFCHPFCHTHSIVSHLSYPCRLFDSIFLYPILQMIVL